jgi:hypothetical protein
MFQRILAKASDPSQEEAMEASYWERENTLGGTRGVAEPDIPGPSGIHYSVRQYFLPSNNLEPNDT